MQNANSEKSIREKKELRKIHLKGLKYVACFLPIVIGTIGYMLENSQDLNEVTYGSLFHKLIYSIYSAGALYFVNPILPVKHPLVYVAAILAIIVTTSIIIGVISTVARRFINWCRSFFANSTVIYTDNPWGEKFLETVKNGFLGGDRFEKAKDYVLMYTDDAKNLAFFEKNKEKMKNRRVFIALDDIDPFLVHNTQNTDFRVFNIYELIARQYWRENHFYKTITSDKSMLKVAIIGYGKVGRAVFKYGFMNGIYSLNQSIEYHIWGCNEIEKAGLDKMDTANADRVFAHEVTEGSGDMLFSSEDLEMLAKMDRVIVTTDDYVRVIQYLLSANLGLQIHCYTPEKIDLLELFVAKPKLKALSDDDKSKMTKEEIEETESRFQEDYDTKMQVRQKQMVSFGDVEDILTEENIKDEKLYLTAKLVNFDYERDYGASVPPNATKDTYLELAEKSWNKLSGFKQGSNIARADYLFIRDEMVKDNVPDDELARLEHIRWNRYHFYYGWKFGQRNDDKRLHNLLVEYDNLPESEQKKDEIFDKDIADFLEEEMAKMRR